MLGIIKYSSQLVLKFLDSLGKSWEHHDDILKNGEKINTVDLIVCSVICKIMKRLKLFIKEL